MIVGVPRESYPGERRVALVPTVLPHLAKAGLEVVIEAGAGVQAGFHDSEYAAKGARGLGDRSEVFRAADIVVQVLCYGSHHHNWQTDGAPFARRHRLLRVSRSLRPLSHDPQESGP